MSMSAVSPAAIVKTSGVIVKMADVTLSALVVSVTALLAAELPTLLTARTWKRVFRIGSKT